MADLIGRLRTLVGDPAGASQTFDDQTLQDYLDRHQTVARYARLRPKASYGAGGVVEYLDYYADVGDWEADETLVDGSYAELSPAAADRLTGHWAFETSQGPPVCIVGKFYDVYGAAADVLEAWAAREKLSFDFDADGQAFKRSQKVAMLLQMAREYRRQQRPAFVLQVRTDAAR
jgi:hypothetical protein